MQVEATTALAFPGGLTAHLHGDRQTGPHPAPVAMGAMLLEGTSATLRITPDGHLVLAMEKIFVRLEIR